MSLLTPIHQGISVPDADASADWYREMFGFELVSDEVVEPLGCRIVFLRLGSFELELFQYMGEDRRPLPPERREPNEDLKTCGVKHVAYAVEDLRGLAAQLKAKGADFAMGPFPMHDDLVCFVRDNSGTLLELIQRGGANGE